MKNLLKKIWNIFITIISTLFFGVAAIFLLKEKDKNDAKKEAEIKKEEIKDELEKKSADDIVADSPNADTISSNIEQQKSDFHKRVEDRLRQNELQRR